MEKSELQEFLKEIQRLRDLANRLERKIISIANPISNVKVKRIGSQEFLLTWTCLRKGVELDIQYTLKESSTWDHGQKIFSNDKKVKIKINKPDKYKDPWDFNIKEHRGEWEYGTVSLEKISNNK